MSLTWRGLGEYGNLAKYYRPVVPKFGLVRVTLIKSPIKAIRSIQESLRCLKLNKINQTAIHKNVSSCRGLIYAAKKYIKVEDIPLQMPKDLQLIIEERCKQLENIVKLKENPPKMSPKFLPEDVSSLASFVNSERTITKSPQIEEEIGRKRKLSWWKLREMQLKETVKQRIKEKELSKPQEELHEKNSSSKEKKQQSTSLLLSASDGEKLDENRRNDTDSALKQSSSYQKNKRRHEKQKQKKQDEKNMKKYMTPEEKKKQALWLEQRNELQNTIKQSKLMKEYLREKKKRSDAARAKEKAKKS